MQEYVYNVVIEPQVEGGYTAFVPKLPGCVSEGESFQETVENIQEALELYLEVLEERTQQIISDNTQIIEVGVRL